MKDLGPFNYFLRIEIARSQAGFYLSQYKYALEILSEVEMLGSKPVSTPMELNHQLAKAAEELCDNPNRYCRLAGKLI